MDFLFRVSLVTVEVVGGQCVETNYTTTGETFLEGLEYVSLGFGLRSFSTF